MRVRCQKILDAARGQDCTANTPYCNFTPETVVACHYGEPGEKGMGRKPDDTSAIFACSDCHDALDGRRPWECGEDKDYYWFRGMRRTWKLLLEEGVLS